MIHAMLINKYENNSINSKNIRKTLTKIDNKTKW